MANLIDYANLELAVLKRSKHIYIGKNQERLDQIFQFPFTYSPPSQNGSKDVYNIYVNEERERERRTLSKWKENGNFHRNRNWKTIFGFPFKKTIESEFHCLQ